MLQPWKANSLLPLHTSGDVSSDCSKVTPSTQILPSLVGAHNNNLPNPPLPSCLSILFVYSAACLEQWLVHPHLLHSYLKVWHRQAAATVSSLPSLSCSWLCLIFLLLWILVDSVVWRLTLTSRVEAFCIKNPALFSLIALANWKMHKHFFLLQNHIVSLWPGGWQLWVSYHILKITIWQVCKYLQNESRAQTAKSSRCISGATS